MNEGGHNKQSNASHFRKENKSPVSPVIPYDASESPSQESTEDAFEEMVLTNTVGQHGQYQYVIQVSKQERVAEQQRVIDIVMWEGRMLSKR